MNATTIRDTRTLVLQKEKAMTEEDLKKILDKIEKMPKHKIKQIDKEFKAYIKKQSSV